MHRRMQRGSGRDAAPFFDRSRDRVIERPKETGEPASNAGLIDEEKCGVKQSREKERSYEKRKIIAAKSASGW